MNRRLFYYYYILFLPMIAILVGLFSVQIYNPLDCNKIFLDMEYPRNVTIYTGDNAQRWIDSNGHYLTPQEDIILIEDPVRFRVRCIGGEHEKE